MVSQYGLVYAVLYGSYSSMQFCMDHTAVSSIVWIIQQYAVLYGSYSSMQFCMNHTAVSSVVWNIQHYAVLHHTKPLEHHYLNIMNN